MATRADRIRAIQDEYERETGERPTRAVAAVLLEAAGDVRTCPACGMAAAPGDRYCEPCGSAPDRTSWIDGPDPMADPREAYEFEAAGVALDPDAIDEWSESR